jgi:hypothetical protein
VRSRLPVLGLLAGLALGSRAGAQCALPGLDESPRIPGVPFDELTRRANETWEAKRTADAVRFYRAKIELNPLWHDGW